MSQSFPVVSIIRVTVPNVSICCLFCFVLAAQSSAKVQGTKDGRRHGRW